VGEKWWENGQKILWAKNIAMQIFFKEILRICKKKI
jgi:hypothetical protein